ncbi:MAG: hypothetical protein U9Q37_10315 [Euryarchaeota archaeon]|nr:hypothetical protein [Euryarchaeota archaeon]
MKTTESVRIRKFATNICIIDGGRCAHRVTSTVVDLVGMQEGRGVRAGYETPVIAAVCPHTVNGH